MANILKIVEEQTLLLKTAYKRDGLWYVIRSGIKYIAQWPLNVITTFYYRYICGGKSVFTFQGKPYDYLYHSYNTTWKNERGIEVPIIWRLVQENSEKRILEIGNVLRHYVSCQHDVLDLTEKYPGVINQDIGYFKPQDKYDLAVSISTFEHIGCWEKEPRQPERLLQAIQNILENILSPGGRLVITVPLGQNPDMERYLAAGKINFTQLICMKQVDSVLNEWSEFSWSEIRDREFSAQGEWCGKNKSFLIGIMQKPQITD